MMLYTDYLFDIDKDSNFTITKNKYQMTAEQIKQYIIGGEWVSITPEVRPSISPSATGAIQPFYLTRVFRYTAGDKFECIVINYADPNGKVPLVKIEIKGHIIFRGEHLIAEGAYQVDYVTDEAYEVTPLHQGFADAINKIPTTVFNKWEVNVMQDVKGKAFPAFGLTEGQIYVDYDLIYIYNDLFFNGSKNVDGRAFDKPENRPTNLQVPLVRRG
ncbi:hypothetical protein [Mucilaginibacter dorajii]|nr:hypothetical protein [Mucilaginibacter dorajii]MCS3736448.1 hypothetical protein [Mucilaginibacter dorajii]